MTGIELGLEERIELVPTMVSPGKANPEFSGRFNPLRKIPALTLADGTTLFDSTVVCEYLDHLDGAARMFPRAGAKRWEVLTAHSLANGLMDASVLLRYEQTMRPNTDEAVEWGEDLWEKIERGLAWFEERAAPAEERINIADIALACLLGYLDFRFDQHQWRSMSPKLAQWHSVIAERPSYRNTRPQP